MSRVSDVLRGIKLEPSEHGGFIATNDELQIVAAGDTATAALRSFADSLDELPVASRPREPFTEAGRRLARQSLGKAVTIDQILDIEDQARATEDT